MCVILHNWKQWILQTDQLRDKPGEEEPSANLLYPCHKTFISTGIYVPFSSLAGKELFPFPAADHSSFSLAGLPYPMGPRRRPEWQGEAAVVPWCPHVVMPKMTVRYSK